MKLASLLFSLLIFPLLLFAAPKQNKNPITKINQWFKGERERTEGRLYKFATLATASSSGKPYTRMVELVRVNPQSGLVFFTHRNSVKVKHLEANPQAALNIYLPKTGRQVSLSGTVSSVSIEETEKAWNRMPRGMRLSFLISDHKRDPVALKTLEQRKKRFDEQYKKREIPPPAAFIGYRFDPEEVIFFEVRKRDFPIKELSTLNSSKEWVSSLIEP